MDTDTTAHSRDLFSTPNVQENYCFIPFHPPKQTGRYLETKNKLPPVQPLLRTLVPEIVQFVCKAIYCICTDGITLFKKLWLLSHQKGDSPCSNSQFCHPLPLVYHQIHNALDHDLSFHGSFTCWKMDPCFCFLPGLTGPHFQRHQALVIRTQTYPRFRGGPCYPFGQGLLILDFCFTLFVNCTLSGPLIRHSLQWDTYLG